MRIRCTNTYGDRETVKYWDIPNTELPQPAADLDDWESMELLWDYLWTYTGDGTGENEPAYYEVEIIDATNPDLVGLTREWA